METLEVAVRIWMMVVVMLGWVSARAEVSCYRTPAQAAVQIGEQEGGGYRLVIVRADAGSGRTWATVRSCGHPEWPAVVVAGQTMEARTAVEAHPGYTRAARPVVSGGGAVRVVRTDASARLETAGVAQAAGRVGDRIAVRLAGLGGGDGRLVTAVIRSAEMVEIEQ